jgi:LPS-assembly protein
MRFSTTPSSSTDVLVDYDDQNHRFDGAGIVGGITHGQNTGGIAYFFRSGSNIQFPADQFQGSYQFGSAYRHGISLGLRAAYDIEHRTFQGSTTELRYNTDCYGLSMEWFQYDIGVRRESRLLFSFTLKDLGSYGNIRRQDRIF